MVDAPAHGPMSLGCFDPETALAALRSIGDAVVCTDIRGRISFMNPVAEKLTGWVGREAIGRMVGDVLNLFDEDAGHSALNPVSECLRRRECYIRESGLLLLARKGNAFDIGMSAAPLRTATGDVVGSVILFNNVTEIRAHQKMLAHSALHDGLTGLPNRTSFMASFRQAVSQARSEGRGHILCFIDLDRFKLVNDRAGHAAGDALLADVAKVIKSHCAASDVAARLGGDEFAVLMRDRTVAEAEAAAEKIIRSIAGLAFSWEGEAFRIGASAGAAIVSRDSPELSEILHQADKACYAAKESGRNRVCVYDQARRPVFERFPSDADDAQPVRLNLH